MMRHDPTVVLMILTTAGVGGGARSALHQAPPLLGVTASSRVMVMPPLVVETASPGNGGRDFAVIEADVATRILSIVRERFADVSLAGRASSPAPRLFGYESAAGQALTTEEMNGAIDAYAHGATHLLVPAITEWKEMRAGDPVGALVLRHNSVTITLRLMRLQPAALVDQATFHHRARFTVNQTASGLLDDRFRRTVLQLIGG